jgi:hypothetical protein
MQATPIDIVTTPPGACGLAIVLCSIRAGFGQVLLAGAQELESLVSLQT